MPRKLRRAKYRETPLTVRDLSPVELVSLMASWFPGCGRGRWQSWAHFLDDYSAVREDLLDRRLARPLFAERVRCFVERYGLAELEGLSYYEALKAALDGQM